MRNKTWMLALCLFVSGSAGAAGLTLPGLRGEQAHRVAYHCGAGHLTVTYINTARQSLALLDVQGHPMVFVDTPAASGVRYQAGRYVWWTKGESGELYDVLAGKHPEAMLSDCRTVHP